MKKITVTRERADRLDMWNLGLFTSMKFMEIKWFSTLMKDVQSVNLIW